MFFCHKCCNFIASMRNARCRVLFRENLNERMMRKFFLFLTFLTSMTYFVACDGDKTQREYPNNEAVNEAFHKRYPNASRPSWDTEKGYAVVDFRQNGTEVEAWFDMDGNWILSETDIRYKDLPQPIRQDYEGGSYAKWRMGDIDCIERPDREALYILEVESGREEYELHYLANGMLVKAVPDRDGGYVPCDLPEDLSDTLQLMYPEAVVIEVERFNIGIEIDIMHENIHKEVWFNVHNSWICTCWEISLKQVPALVMTALKASPYGDYHIDEVDYVQKPDGIFYEFELEKGNLEKDVVFNAQGQMTSAK